MMVKLLNPLRLDQTKIIWNSSPENKNDVKMYYPFQTSMTFYLLWNIKLDVLLSVHAALFHAFKVNEDEYHQTSKRENKH